MIVIIIANTNMSVYKFLGNISELIRLCACEMIHNYMSEQLWMMDKNYDLLEFMGKI